MPRAVQTEFAITDDPMISILIPNKDHLVDLQTCIRSITEQSDYENYEILRTSFSYVLLRLKRVSWDP